MTSYKIHAFDGKTLTKYTKMYQKLYDYLCGVVGTEKIIEIRRSFFKILESYYNEKTASIRVIFSGSKAEGLDLHGSDIDLMNVLPYLAVYDSESDSNTVNLIMDTSNASPGFAILKIRGSHFFSSLVVETEIGKLLSNEKFKQFCLDVIRWFGFHIHGPCLSTPNEDADIAVCIQGHSWPRSALQWIVRPRTTEWPKDLITEIVEEGVLFVPIGSKFGSKTDNKYEWRISFSQAEKRLIHSFSHTELLCYALLKIVLKDVLNQNTKLKGLLCSYYLKTSMFWLKEELSSDVWKPCFLFRCFDKCLKRIIYWIECGYCPNYFVPENNMFAGKFDDNSFRLDVAETLNNICNDHISIFINSKSLYEFLLCNSVKENISCYVTYGDRVSVCEEDTCIFPLMYIAKSMNIEQNRKGMMEAIFTILNRNRLCIQKSKGTALRKFENDLNINIFAEVCRQFCHNINYNFKKGNKILYLDHKKVLSHLLISTHCSIAVWISVSVFFYQHKQYNNAIHAAHYLTSQITQDMFVAGQYGKPYNRIATTKYFEQLSFSQRFKLKCREPFKECFLQNTFLHGCQLGLISCLYHANYSYLIQDGTYLDEDIFKKWMRWKMFRTTLYSDGVILLPETFGHFIRFMCYHCQHDNASRFRCLEEMIASVVNQPDDSLYRFWSFPYLFRALTLIDTLSPEGAFIYAQEISCQYKFLDTDFFRNVIKCW